MDDLLALILNLLSLCLMVVCTVIFLQNSYNRKISQCFAGCQILIINWIVCHILDIFSNSLPAKLLFGNIGYLSVCSIGAMFLLFALYYTKADIAESNIFKAILFVPSAVLYFFELTDPIFHLYFKSYLSYEVLGGYGFYITAVYNYALLFIAVLLMTIRNIKSYKERLPQIILISLSAVVPLIFNFISLLDIFSLKYDFTPVSFSVTSLLIFLAIYKYEFITIPPLIVKHLMRSVNEGILVANKKRKVTYINETLKKTFGFDDSLIQKNIKTAFEYICEKASDRCETLNEIFFTDNGNSATLELSDNRFFEVSKTSVSNGKRIISYIFIFYNVTEYVNFNKELSAKNLELSEANNRLEKMNAIEKSLAVERERTRIAQELHDSIGHRLVSIMTLLKLSQINTESSQENIAKALNSAELLLGDVRNCVAGIRTFSEINIVKRINDLIEEKKAMCECIELTVIGEDTDRHSFAGDIIFSIVREAVTNSIRHGKANRIDVILKFSDESIRIYIIDNGIGCDKIVADYGLNGMKAKVNSTGGIIEFTSFSGGGFSVKAYIPVEVKEIDQGSDCR